LAFDIGIERGMIHTNIANVKFTPKVLDVSVAKLFEVDKRE